MSGLQEVEGGNKSRDKTSVSPLNNKAKTNGKGPNRQSRDRRRMSHAPAAAGAWRLSGFNNTNFGKNCTERNLMRRESLDPQERKRRSTRDGRAMGKKPPHQATVKNQKRDRTGHPKENTKKQP